MGFSPLIYLFENLYREETRAALTDVIMSANEFAPYSIEEIERRAHVILPGMKQRTEIPTGPFMGQTIALPARFGSVITASSGTSIHSLSMRAR
jgi:hypothetical protein